MRWCLPLTDLCLCDAPNLQFYFLYFLQSTEKRKISLLKISEKYTYLQICSIANENGQITKMQIFKIGHFQLLRLEMPIFNGCCRCLFNFKEITVEIVIIIIDIVCHQQLLIPIIRIEFWCKTLTWKRNRERESGRVQKGDNNRSYHIHETIKLNYYFRKTRWKCDDTEEVVWGANERRIIIVITLQGEDMKTQKGQKVYSLLAGIRHDFKFFLSYL